MGCFSLSGTTDPGPRQPDYQTGDGAGPQPRRATVFGRPDLREVLRPTADAETGCLKAKPFPVGRSLEFRSNSDSAHRDAEHEGEYEASDDDSIRKKNSDSAYRDAEHEDEYEASDDDSIRKKTPDLRPVFCWSGLGIVATEWQRLQRSVG